MQVISLRYTTVFAFLFLPWLCLRASDSSANVAKDLTIDIPRCDRVFNASYMGMMYAGKSAPRVSAIFKRVAPDPYPSDEGAHDRICAAVRSFSIPEKCRFGVLSLLAFRLDGERSENFGSDYFGADQKRVGQELSKITDVEWEFLCKARGVPVADKIDAIHSQIKLMLRN